MTGYVYGASRARASAADLNRRLVRAQQKLTQAATQQRVLTAQRDMLHDQLEAIRRDRERRIKAAQKRTAPDPNAPAVDYSPEAGRARLVAATAEADRWRRLKITIPNFYEEDNPT